MNYPCFETAIADTNITAYTLPNDPIGTVLIALAVLVILIAIAEAALRNSIVFQFAKYLFGCYFRFMNYIDKVKK